MSTDVQGLLKFSANGDPAGMLARVQAMVGELAALGVTPRVVVTVDLASTSRSSSSPISVATGMSVRAAGITLTSPDPMPRSAGERSGIDGGESDGAASGASMSSGEDFLGGARVLKVDDMDKVDGVDWSQLSTMAAESLESLESGWTTWRKVGKAVRLELVQAVLAQPTESGEPMKTTEFDRIKPAWMSKAGNLTSMFECSWPELRTLRLSE